MSNLRHFVSQIFYSNFKTTSLGMLINTSLLILIFLNIIVIILESVASIEQQYSSWFKTFEIFSVIIFSIEYVLRLWICINIAEYKNLSAVKSRLKYFVTPMAIIDLLAILPFYLSMFFMLDLRLLRIFRLIRGFKLTRYSAAMTTLTSVLKDEMPALIAAYFIMFTVIILASSGIYILEHEIQPNEFGSIPESMWWAVTTLTTVGYGDITPITNGGKIFGGIITLIGIAMVALPTGIIASGFSNRFHMTRQNPGPAIPVNPTYNETKTQHEQETLSQIQLRLGISNEEAKHIYKKVIAHHIKKQTYHMP